MQTEFNQDDDKKKSLKEIYNDSVKLLELLNILIPKIETYTPNLELTLIQETADKCFELGANLATNVENLQGEIDDDDNNYFPHGYGC